MLQPQKQQTIIYGGGLDLVTPAIEVRPGRLLEAKNYECALNNGYRVMAGYERFDGRSSPTGSSFFALATGTFTGTFTLLETVTGGTSSATGILTTIGVKGLYLVTLTGTFVSGEVVTGGTSSATATTTSTAFANITISNDEKLNDVRFDKEIYFRNLIAVVPGTGKVRGIFQHEAVTLAVRDLDGSSAKMYKATTSGWTLITTSHTVFFDTRLIDFPVAGSTINDGVGNTAVLQRVSLKTTSGAAGYIVLTGYTAGFAVAALITNAAAATIATITVVATEVTLAVGGKFEWFSHTFTGAVGFYRVYCCDGKNPAFEYDPVANVISPIYSDQDNISLDTPTFISIYRNHLFIGFERGIMRNSDPGNPFLWDAAAGALETAIGAAVTGFDPIPSSLIITTRRTTYSFTGKTISDFVLDVASRNTGAISYTMQHIGTTYMLDDRGIIELNRVLAFGNFENATVSRLIQPLLTSLRLTIVASTIVLTNNIYRLFTSDGKGITLTFQEGKVSGFSFFDLNKTVFVASNAEDDQGMERIFFGGDDGFVYEMEKGRSFDGSEKEFWIQTVFQYLRSPTVLKSFFRSFFDVSISGSATILFTAVYTNGTPDVRETLVQSDTTVGFKSQWDIGAWDEATFDASIVSDAYIDLTGSGDSISLVLYQTTAKDDIFTLKDSIYHYKVRRQLRGSR